MKFRINQDLPIKYTLNLHQSMQGYPTRQDFIFDVSTHLARVAEAKGKDWDPDDIKFSTKTLKYVFGENMQDEGFLQSMKSILSDLISTSALTKKGEFIFIPNSEFSKYYLLA
jgi:hypothetical protein